MTLQEKFSLFKDWVVNQKEEISDPSNVYQCMDLMFAWAMFLNVPKIAVAHPLALEVFTQPNSFTTQYFDLISNSPDFVPQIGDIAVFDKTPNNPAGHVSVCTGEGNKVSFYSLDENWAGQSTVMQVEHNYDNPKLLGVLRPKVSVTTVELNPKMDLSSLDNNTALKETYGVLEKQQIEAKFIAKDLKIYQLLTVPNPTPPDSPSTSSVVPNVTVTSPGGGTTNLNVTPEGTSVITTKPNPGLISLIVGIWKSVLARLGNHGN